MSKLAEPKAAAPASEPDAKADAAATPAPASAGEKPADSAKAAAADAAPGSKPEPNEDGKPEAPAAAEASAPASKPTPSPGSVTKPSGDAEQAPGSVSPTSGSPTSLGDRKKRALSGNLKPGDTLGRYELLLPVASGGMATVWAARLEGTAGFQKTVAIKTMLPGLSSDADFEEMFLDEARVAARIRHPNVVEIFDLGEEGETLYLVMEWVEGETVGALQKGAKAHGGIPAPILLRLASQVCAGLHAAHELRDDKGALVDLVHRDISPANILVSRTGFVKIVDFGVAKSKARMYTTRVGGMIKGKTPYLSPEQLAGQPIDRRSDIFSFGAVLYVLATGLHPFRGENDGKTIENIVLRDPVSLRKLEPSIPAELEAIILKALAKDRDKRWESASEMQRAIDTLAASIGQTVNDDDVAAFVKKVAGDGLEKRATALREAIALADTGKPPIQPRQALSPESGKESAGPPSGSAPPIDDVMKVEIDDVDVEVGGGPAKPSAADAGAGVVASEPAITAPSLGSDSAPDTLAAASTEPLDAEDAPPPRKRGPLIALGAVGGVLALAGIFALASGGGDEPARTGTASTAVAATATADALRTGAPAETATPPRRRPRRPPRPPRARRPSRPRQRRPSPRRRRSRWRPPRLSRPRRRRGSRSSRRTRRSPRAPRR
jgi:serine/threonine protein kinase